MHVPAPPPPDPPMACERYSDGHRVAQCGLISTILGNDFGKFPTLFIFHITLGVKVTVIKQCDCHWKRLRNRFCTDVVLESHSQTGS